MENIRNAENLCSSNIDWQRNLRQIKAWNGRAAEEFFSWWFLFHVWTKEFSRANCARATKRQIGMERRWSASNQKIISAVVQRYMLISESLPVDEQVEAFHHGIALHFTNAFFRSESKYIDANGGDITEILNGFRRRDSESRCRPFVRTFYFGIRWHLCLLVGMFEAHNFRHVIQPMKLNFLEVDFFCWFSFLFSFFRCANAPFSPPLGWFSAILCIARHIPWCLFFFSHE